MNTIHKCCIVTHFRRHRPEEVTNTLLVFYINFEVSNHHDTATRSNTLSSSAELTGFHIAFHDVDPILLIEGYSGYFIKAYNIILANQASLSIAVVDKHTGNGCFSSRHKMRIGRNLLEKMRFTSTTRAKLNHIVVAFNKWNHPQQKNVLSSLGQTIWFKATT